MRAPELNPVENIWQFMRDNWLSNRVFKSAEEIVGHPAVREKGASVCPVGEPYQRDPALKFTRKNCGGHNIAADSICPPHPGRMTDSGDVHATLVRYEKSRPKGMLPMKGLWMNETEDDKRT